MLLVDCVIEAVLLVDGLDAVLLVDCVIEAVLLIDWVEIVDEIVDGVGVVLSVD